MSTDETNKTVNETIGSTETPSTPDAAISPNPNWSRRTFLKAAALGAVTAAALGRGSAVLAHEDTKSACTANDIEVTGGQIINEPCGCTAGGTFPAIAQFQVTNNNNATRKCIALHLGAGGTLDGKDFYLVDENGSSNIGGLGTTKTMYAHLGQLDCNFGRECYAGSVIAFQTAKNQSDEACPTEPSTKYPGGQCRRQEICITGFNATLSCVGSCNVSCGGTLSLLATAVGGTAGATDRYTFSLYHPDGTLAETRTDVTSPQTFTVTNPQAGTYSLRVQDSNNCERSATSGSVTISSITAHIAVSGNSTCNNGVLTFTGSADGCTGTPAFRFRVDNGSWVNGSGTNNAQFTYSPTVSGGALDTACHTVTVEASCGGCTDTTSCSVSQCVTSTVGAEDTAC